MKVCVINSLTDMMTPSRDMPEDILLKLVLEACGARYIKAAHFPDAKRCTSPGFPDLCMISPGGNLAFAELKSQWGELSGQQADWRWRLLAGGHQYHLWRPSDLDNGSISRALTILAKEMA